MKNVIFAFVLALLVVFSMAAGAQEYPKMEASVSYSFVNVHPDIPSFTSFNVNGGGGSFVYNVTPWIGIKADFNGYTAGNNFTKQIQDLGYAGNINGNVFTYMFGPQFKKHSGKFQPFGQALFGAAHTNAYATIFNAEGIASGNSNNNAFAMEFGGGLDYALNKHIQIRPAEVDYLYTRFGANGTSYTGNQNNFKYAAGVNFTFGGTK
jgi:hypothetical protein